MRAFLHTAPRRENAVRVRSQDGTCQRQWDTPEPVNDNGTLYGIN